MWNLEISEYQTIAIVGVAVLLVCYCGICAGVSIARWNLVKENSAYYKSVLILNRHTKYHVSVGNKGNVQYVMHVKSKAQFDKTGLVSALNEYLSFHRRKVNLLLDAVHQNRIAYREYSAEFNSLSSIITVEECKNLRINYEKYKKIEAQLVAAEKIDMIQTLTVTCVVQYTSPQGRNHYSKDCVYLESEIRTALKELDRRNAYQATEEYRRKNERSKVTPSLRYDVMKRDGFRCRLCGRSADSGVELEVDHIVPISKGGSTTYSNLQTLCRDCNRGKSAKM